jgi:hypothetical protein
MTQVLMDHKKLKALISLHGRAEGFGGQLAEDEVKVGVLEGCAQCR